MTPFVALVVLVTFAGASFLRAGRDTSLFSLGKWQLLRQLEGRFPLKAAIISRLLAEPLDLLATLVLGNSVANAGIVMVALWLAVQREWPLAPVLAALLVLILFGAEVAPKALAVRAPELWALRVAGLMEFLLKASRPLRHVAQGDQSRNCAVAPIPANAPSSLSDAEYEDLLEMALSAGRPCGKREIILQIINLNRRTGERSHEGPPANSVPSRMNLSVDEMIEASRTLQASAPADFMTIRWTQSSGCSTRVVLLLGTGTPILPPPSNSPRSCRRA